MKIILDNREHHLYEKCQAYIEDNNEKYSRIYLEKKTLLIGDIILETDNGETICIIERKTFADLLASIKDGRYEEQSLRLKHTSGIHSHNIIYLLEGMFSQLRSPQEKQVIYSAMASIQFYKGFTSLRTSSLQETAELIIHYADKIHRNHCKNEKICFLPQDPNLNEPNTLSVDFNKQSLFPSTDNLGFTTLHSLKSTNQAVDTVVKSYSNFVKSVKKENITIENINEIMLCQIPDVSSQTASVIMKEFKTISNLTDSLKLNSSILDYFTCTDKNGKERKIRKNVIENIKLYLLEKDFV